LADRYDLLDPLLKIDLEYRLSKILMKENTVMRQRTWEQVDKTSSFATLKQAAVETATSSVSVKQMFDALGKYANYLGTLESSRR